MEAAGNWCGLSPRGTRGERLISFFRDWDEIHVGHRRVRIGPDQVELKYTIPLDVSATQEVMSS
jgi:hypothetical protein